MWKKNLVNILKKNNNNKKKSSFWSCVTSSVLVCLQGTQNFGGIRVGNGPTEDQAEIIQHDQLSQHSEEEHEVRRKHCGGSESGQRHVACLSNSAAV